VTVVLTAVVESIEWQAMKDLHHIILSSASVVSGTAKIQTVKMFRDHVEHAVLYLDCQADPAKHLLVVI